MTRNKTSVWCDTILTITRQTRLYSKENYAQRLFAFITSTADSNQYSGSAEKLFLTHNGASQLNWVTIGKTFNLKCSFICYSFILIPIEPKHETTGKKSQSHEILMNAAIDAICIRLRLENVEMVFWKTVSWRLYHQSNMLHGFKGCLTFFFKCFPVIV